MDKKIKKATEFVKTHKLASVGIAVALLVFGVILFNFLGNLMFLSGYKTYAPGAYSPLPNLDYIGGGQYERTIDQKATDILASPTEYNIKKGSINVKTKDAVSDYEILRQKTQSLNGWIESMSKNDDFSQVAITAQLRIPYDNFDSFTDWMVNNFDVSQVDIQLYKVSVEKKQDEIQILTEALDVYDRLLKKAEQGLNVTDYNLEIIMKITNKRLEVMRLLREYGYSIEQTQKESDYTTVTVRLTQEKQIKLIPEDMGKELRTKIRNSIQDVTMVGIDLITVPIVVLTKVLVWILYVFIVLIPAFIGVKLLVKIFKWIWKKV